MSSNESIVEEAALEWVLRRQCFGGHVRVLGYASGYGPVAVTYSRLSARHADAEYLSGEFASRS